MIQAVLWDLDGVIIDTGEAHYRAWLQVFQPLGIQFTRDNFREIFGMNNTTALSRYFDPETQLDLIHQVDQEKEALFREQILGQLHLLPGVAQWLSYFKDHGIPQAVASSAPQVNIDLIIHGLKVGRFFDALVSGATIPGKPDPGVFLAAARAVQAAPEYCVVVEDAVAGIQAACRAGMKSVAVTTTNPPDSLRDASLLLHSLADFDPAGLEAQLWPGDPLR